MSVYSPYYDGSKIIKRIENLENAISGSTEVDLSGVTDGGYLYSHEFFASTKWFTIDVDIPNSVDEIRIIGAVKNEFCLYMFMNGDSVVQAAERPEPLEPGYIYRNDVTVLVPTGANKIRCTFIKEEPYSMYFIDDANVNNDYDDVTADLVKAQKYIANDWHFNFIDLNMALGAGNNHIIPATKNTWNVGSNTDLTQKYIMMRDGIHPVYGHGVTKMYGRIIANQLALVSPTYLTASADTEINKSYWDNKNMLWLGTSIPAGSDPAIGVYGDDTAYPYLVASQLGANVVNNARGSSCVRINATTGNYDNMAYHHFLRSLSRTLEEVNVIASNWSSIYPKIEGAPSSLSNEDKEIMRSHSFENLLLPYLDGTNTMPDLFVIDHGHNDQRPFGVDGKRDMLIKPTVENLNSGKLAPDSFMTANGYAKLKIAMNDNLSGIPALKEFATSINRNSYIGATNFIITLILRYNPRARIVIVGDYI